VTSEAILLEFIKFPKSRQNAYTGLAENLEDQNTDEIAD
jgi:hypothetical protein